jgi:DNA-binding transcriptional regulator YdaS (Cro superfamily)
MELQIWTAAERGRALSLARHLRITAPVVSDWCTKKKQIPIEQCVPIERFTRGEVTCEEMRPDKAVDFAYLRGVAEESTHSLPIAPWTGSERRSITGQPPDPVSGRRQVDKPEAFPVISPVAPV